MAGLDVCVCAFRQKQEWHCGHFMNVSLCIMTYRLFSEFPMAKVYRIRGYDMIRLHVSPFSILAGRDSRQSFNDERSKLSDRNLLQAACHEFQKVQSAQNQAFKFGVAQMFQRLSLVLEQKGCNLNPSNNAPNALAG